MKPLSEFRFGQSVPESFVFSRDGRYLYGSSYYTGVSNIFRYEVATGAVEAVSNAETGFFRPVPLADGRLVVLNYTADGFVPAIIEPRPIEDVSAIKFLGTEVAEKYPGRQDLAGAASEHGRRREADHAQRARTFRCATSRSANAFPVLQGYKNSVGIGYHFNFEDPLQFASLGITAAYTPSSSLPGDAARPRRHHRPLPVLARPSCRGTGRISTTCSVRPSAAARATRPSSATTGR